MSSSLTWLASLQQTLTSYRFLNTVSNLRSNITAHYDISNDMFAGFLSEDMTYSCAVFPDLDADLIDRPHRSCTSSEPDVHRLEHADRWAQAVAAAYVEQKSKRSTAIFMTDPSSISTSDMTTPDERSGAVAEGADTDADANVDSDSERTYTAIPTPSSRIGKVKDELYDAQMRKIYHIIRKADIRPGHRVLEIGPGWGALAIEAVRMTGCQVDTLTLSIAQKVLAEERITAAGPESVDKIRVHLMDYSSMPKEWKGTLLVSR
jgi:cyclopropane-fatty-acyl-phospholipid synthase